MPLAVVTTNLPKESIPHDFMKKLTDVLQETFECNLPLCMVDLRPSSMMMRAGSTDPLVNVEIHHSHDKLNDTTKRDYSKALANFMVEQLHLNLDRILILFFDSRCTTKPQIGTTTEDKVVVSTSF